MLQSQKVFVAEDRKWVREQRRWVFKRRHDLAEDLTRWLHTWINFHSLQRMASYPLLHRAYKKVEVPPKGPVRAILAKPPPERPDLIDHPAYERYLRSLAWLWCLETEGSSGQKYEATFAWIDAALDGEPRELMRLGLLEYALGGASEDEELEVLGRLIARTGGPPDKVEVMRAKLRARRNLGPGRPAPDFTLPDRNDDPVTLSSFQGQVVVLDFWGTWCGPCIEAIPEVKALQEELAGEPVAFVFVALENRRDKAAWHRFLDEHGLDSGTHLFAEGRTRAPELERWDLVGVPRYAVIDADGRIVNANTWGPGGKLGELVRQTLDAAVSSSYDPVPEPGPHAEEYE